MAKLYGAQKMLLMEILNVQGEGPAYVEDRHLWQATRIELNDVRNWLLTLEQEEYVDLALTSTGISASITPKGRLMVNRFSSVRETVPPRRTGPAPQTNTGRDRALVIGIGDYSPPIQRLPAIANDVLEIGRLLSSDNGGFKGSNVTSLVDAAATRRSVMDALQLALSDTHADDTVFVYLAGHGAIAEDKYFFVTYDTMIERVAATGISLTEIRKLFERSPSQRGFLWLDFCHSGGILSRHVEAPPDDRAVLERTLRVVQGKGKLIMAACTAGQSAWESPTLGHGFFTHALLRGLKGEAAHDGEVTVSSLYDFIDRTMGSDRQRPMLFGQMTGRIVLMS